MKEITFAKKGFLMKKLLCLLLTCLLLMPVVSCAPSVSEITIGGVDISEFTIVYPKAPQYGEEEQAYALADHIKEVLGVELTVASDSAGKTEHEIVIGQSAHISSKIKLGAKELDTYKLDTATATLYAADGYLWLIANSIHNVEAAVAKLIEDTTPKKHGERIDLDYSEGVNAVSAKLGEGLKVMSYNVQTGSASNVSPRVSKVLGHIYDFDADVVGAQEINYNWLTEMGKRGFLDTYTRVGEAREGSSQAAGNEYSCIFYKTDKFNLIDSGTYWLSDTPNQISMLDSCDYYRIMTYAVLERKSDGLRFLHVNTHLEWDHADAPTNLLQTEIMLDLTDGILEKNGDMPVYFTGDFNVTSSSAGYKKMKQWGVDDARSVAEKTTDANTFSGGSTIDFCFVSHSDFIVGSFSVGSKYEGSDHYPVFVELYFPKK